ncbi:MAG: hypothetical protein ACD_52C00077G0010 [uncultured bacterium]|nr:MAG: hypothetical protein ACD_52C00077G0010 [uncultured bacterium]
MICQNCGKGIVYGRSQQHKRGVAGKRWQKRAQETKRLFKPNLQLARVVVAGKVVRMKLCTNCINRFKKDKKIYSPSVVSMTLG